MAKAWPGVTSSSWSARGRVARKRVRPMPGTMPSPRSWPGQRTPRRRTIVAAELSARHDALDVADGDGLLAAAPAHDHAVAIQVVAQRQATHRLVDQHNQQRQAEQHEPSPSETKKRRSAAARMPCVDQPVQQPAVQGEHQPDEQEAQRDAHRNLGTPGQDASPHLPSALVDRRAPVPVLGILALDDVKIELAQAADHRADGSRRPWAGAPRG